jgi:hypothetical protein
MTVQNYNLPNVDIPSDSKKAIKAYRKSGGIPPLIDFLTT